MSLEPTSSPRLARLARLAAELPAAESYPMLPLPTTMSALPSVALARDIARCAECRTRDAATWPALLCTRHESLWRFEQAVGAEPRPMAGDVGPLLQQVLATGDRSAELLGAFRRQASALNMVWEAHRRGAARLPDEIAELVRAARETAPDFLAGAAPASTRTA